MTPGLVRVCIAVIVIIKCSSILSAIVCDTGGMRTNSSPGEWPVSYHGTTCHGAKGIADEGYNMSKGHRFKYGKGIYSAPSIDVAARYAKVFEFNMKSYIVVFQNRVSTAGLEVISTQETNVGEYWVQPNDNLIRPYGLCIKEV